MADPVTMALVGAGIGAATSKDPLKGAALGGIGGFAGGHMLGSMAAPGAAGSTGNLAALNNLGIQGGNAIAPVGTTIGQGAGNVFGFETAIQGAGAGVNPVSTSGQIGSLMQSAPTNTLNKLANMGVTGGGQSPMSFGSVANASMPTGSMAAEMAQANMPFGQRVAQQAFSMGDKMKANLASGDMKDKMIAAQFLQGDQQQPSAPAAPRNPAVQTNFAQQNPYSARAEYMKKRGMPIGVLSF